MCVSLIKEYLQIYWIKIDVFKYFEFYAYAYTSDHFNGKHFSCNEPLQADNSGTPRHINLATYSRLTCEEVANLLVSLHLLVTRGCNRLIGKTLTCHA